VFKNTQNIDLLVSTLTDKEQTVNKERGLVYVTTMRMNQYTKLFLYLPRPQ
jgi:hypothetical protein